MNRLDELFEEIFRRESPVKVVLSGKRRKSQRCAKVTMRPVESSRGLCFQAEYSFEKKVTHENIDPSAAPEFCVRLMKEDFKQANVFTAASGL